MKSIPLSVLNRRPGEIVDLALTAPVSLTKHGRRSVVIMSAEAYDSLISGLAPPVTSTTAVVKPKRAASSFLVRQAAKLQGEEEG